VILASKPDWLSIFAFNIQKTQNLPYDWCEKITKVTEKYSYKTILDGNSKTSLEVENSQIPVDIVTGQKIYKYLPWLVSLYETELLNFSQRNFKRNLYKCNEIDDAININRITGIGARYEWHLDTNPVTGLLFLDDFNENEGGALIFRNNGHVYSVKPRKGLFICFDARTIPHSVQSLTVNRARISVPMNYYTSASNSGRDAELNNYIKKKVQ